MRLAPILLAALLLTGCTSQGSTGDGPAVDATQSSLPPAPGNGTVPEAGPRELHFWQNGTIDAEIIGMGISPAPIVEIPVDANTTSIVFELSWSSATGFDLDPGIAFPGCFEGPGGGCTANWLVLGTPLATDETGVVASGGSPGAPDSPARLELDAATVAAHLECTTDDAEFCKWYAAIVAASPKAKVTYQMHIHITQAEPAPTA